ncbi:META domain-containing protein [Diaminobutyricimonas aerilata]|uniref:META domain-containing protein n=1 Tax=Diaminobutyricimonas aerilata TaxID=1162967 RepID=A0A2M9CIK8_9MICO|nr:META domain-containing protein [Diaminobutyricimonas aerilata]PJJ71753.1 META domain-containing protein [Diaminobutyricimonas aerilata]
MKRLLPSAALVLALAGCAASPGGADDSTEPGAVAPSGAAAIDLVGMWQVAGVDAATWLRIDETEFLLGAECGVIAGSWRAAHGLLVLGNWGSFGEGCGTEPVGWLERVAGFDSRDDGTRVLTDAAGAEVATLTPSEAPEPPADIDPSLVAVPQVTDAMREALAAPAPLAEDRTPGPGAPARWVAADTAGAAFVEFADDGSWTGSDGCNGNGGRWVADDTGTLLATSGPSTLMACDGAPVPTWMATATTAWLDGDDLVLLDRHGDELGRLTRA